MTGIDAVRVLLILGTLLLGVVVGLVGGILAMMNGSTMPASVARGAVAFAGTVTLCIVIEGALGILA
jgi:hypothetical protein